MSAYANALAFSLGKPVIPVHHLEGHLLSPLLAEEKPDFPFVALLVSGGHTQFMAVRGIGDYELLGESVDDAAGEAFDKTAKLLDLPYPGVNWVHSVCLSSARRFPFVNQHHDYLLRLGDHHLVRNSVRQELQQ